MAQLTNATNPSPKRTQRRYHDSPALWFTVATGSFTVHLLLFLGMHFLKVQVAIAPPEVTEIPIELIDIAPQPTPSSTPNSATDATNSTAELTPQPSVPNASQPNAPQQAATPEIAAGERSPATTSPQPRPNPTSRSTTTPRPTPTPSPRSTNPTPRSTPTPTPDPTPTPISTPTPTPGTSSSSGSPDLPTPPTPPASDPSALGEGGTDDPLGGTVNVEQDAAPAGVRTTLVTSGFPDAIDIPDQIARPKQSSQEFTLDPVNSTCLLTPEIQPYLGQPVEFYVVIDMTSADTGVVNGSSLDVRESSGSPAYDDFAGCLLQQLEFYPALMAGQPIPSSEAIVQITIDPS